jgi:hypothetical protein
VQGSGPAQSPAQEATGVPAGTLRIPPEQIRLSVGGQRGQSKQVSSFDPAPATDPNPRAQRHTVTTRAGSPDAAAIGMRHDRTFIPRWVLHRHAVEPMVHWL